MDRTFTFIRHGKTAGNLKKRYIGVTDEGLLETEIPELKRRKYPEADLVFSSPLLRCRNTSEIIYPNHSIEIVEGLRETDFGVFEGKNYIELSDNIDYQRWIDSGGKMAFPQGESFEEACSRAVRAFERVLELSRTSSKISIVTHGGTIMAILSHIFGDDYYTYHVENCEGYTIDLSHDGIYSGLRPRSFIR